MKVSPIKNILLIVSITMLFASCFKEDEALILPPLSGNVDTLKLNIEDYFSYFNIETGEFIQHIDANSWELGFESGKNGYHISINSGSGWFAAKSNKSEFDNIVETVEDSQWKWDNQAFYPDSTAFGEWFTSNESDTLYNNNLYILANNSSGEYIPAYYLKLLNVNSNSYLFALQSLNTPSVIDTLFVAKNTDKAFIYYSISENKTLDEPDKDSYNLMFGPYYEGLEYNTTIVPYLVRGVLLNPELVSISVDSLNDFNDIQLSNMPNYDFVDTRNFIGYEWKKPVIDFESEKAVYNVRSDKIFLIKTSADSYFKFRFLGYSLKGVNGFPSFQYQELVNN